MLLVARIEPGSVLAERTVAETLGRIKGTTAVAVLRAGQMLIPRGPTLLRSGDEVLAVVTSEARPVLLDQARGRR